MKGSVILIIGIAAIGLYALQQNSVEEKRRYLKEYYSDNDFLLAFIDRFTPEEVKTVFRYVNEFLSKGVDVSNDTDMGKMLTALAAKYNFS